MVWKLKEIICLFALLQSVYSKATLIPIPSSFFVSLFPSHVFFSLFPFPLQSPLAASWFIPVQEHVPGVQIRGICQPTKVRNDEPIRAQVSRHVVGDIIHVHSHFSDCSGECEDVAECEGLFLGTEEEGGPEKVEGELSVVELESGVGFGTVTCV